LSSGTRTAGEIRNGLLGRIVGVVQPLIDLINKRNQCLHDFSSLTFENGDSISKPKGLDLLKGALSDGDQMNCSTSSLARQFKKARCARLCAAA
jgi:hypothetical protein